MGSFTDIREKLIAKLPEGAKPYALLARLDRPVGVWLLLLPCLYAILMGADGGFSLTLSDAKTLTIAVIGAFLMRAAGCTINDLWDRKIDAKVERTSRRPLASGALQPRQAILFLASLLGLSLLLLLQLPLLSIFIGFAAIIPIILYPLMKRITYWPQAFLGVTFNLGILILWPVYADPLPAQAYVLYLSCIFWTLAYDTIYAHQDIRDDIAVGVKSTALKFGEHSKTIVSVFYILFFIGVLIAGKLNEAPLLFYPLMLIPIWNVRTLLRHWNPDDQQSSLDGFKANIGLGLSLLIPMIFS